MGQKTRLLYQTDEDNEEIGKRFYSVLEKQKHHTEDFPRVPKDGGELYAQ